MAKPSWRAERRRQSVDQASSRSGSTTLTSHLIDHFPRSELVRAAAVALEAPYPRAGKPTSPYLFVSMDPGETLHGDDAPQAHKVLTDALSIAPGLAAGTVAEVRVGFRPLSPDGMPSLGGIDGIDGLIMATGLGPIGLTFGPYLGAAAADVARGQGAGIDIAAFRPDRPLVGATSR